MLSFFRRKPLDTEAIVALHAAIVTASRQPALYDSVPDTLDGRFEWLLLHLFLVVNRLQPEAPEFTQRLFDHTFSVLDLNVREMGVGDLGVGKRVKAMGRAFYGRATAYAEGLQNGTLHQALSRNLFGSLPEAPDEATTQPCIDYIHRTVAHLAAQPTAQLLQGQISFGDITP